MTAFGCIVMDPPWDESGGGKIKRGADRHYPLLKTRNIVPTVKSAMTELGWYYTETCHLWLWVTRNFLQDGLLVMSEMGFRYVTNAVWVKDRAGLGQYLRGQHEIVLFGVRGPTHKPDVAPASVIYAPRQRHSQKPEESFEMFERVSPGPYLELFAREKRDGWTVWGNEV